MLYLLGASADGLDAGGEVAVLDVLAFKRMFVQQRSEF